ncbi:MAG: hypothetical protein QOD43_2114, partial [Gaiellaceae bacterium]|nr:hypothetical protein [Gaiellaceae bacterium]
RPRRSVSGEDRADAAAAQDDSARGHSDPAGSEPADPDRDPGPAAERARFRRAERAGRTGRCCTGSRGGARNSPSSARAAGGGHEARRQGSRPYRGACCSHAAACAAVRQPAWPRERRQESHAHGAPGV